MRREDLPRFMQWLTELAEYFPHSKVNFEVVLSGYFQALHALDIVLLGPLCAAVLRQCRYFPTVAELVDLAATLQPAAQCKRCPGGHGDHDGHRVAHYRAGPMCLDCASPIPTPAGYVEAPPPRRFPPLLPEQTPELTTDEVRAMLAGMQAALDKRAERLKTPLDGTDSPQGYRARLTPEAREERRALLRAPTEAA